MHSAMSHSCLEIICCQQFLFLFFLFQTPANEARNYVGNDGGAWGSNPCLCVGLKIKQLNSDA